MKKLHLALAALAALLVSPSVEAGGSNGLISVSQRGDGFARVVRVGNSDVIEALNMPRITAKMGCKVSGYRVLKVGAKSYNPVRNERTRRWKGSAEEGPTAAQLGAICRDGRAAGRVPVKIEGRCTKVKFTLNGVQGTYDSETLQVPFAIDCRGYASTPRKALIMWKHPARKDYLTLPADKNGYAKSLGYRRVHVLGDTPVNAASGRKKMHVGGKDGMRGAAVAPATMIQMHQRGWSIGPNHVGFVEQADDPGRTALHSFYHSDRKDYAVAAGTAIVSELVSDGYSHSRVEGYIFPPK